MNFWSDFTRLTWPQFLTNFQKIYQMKDDFKVYHHVKFHTIPLKTVVRRALQSPAKISFFAMVLMTLFTLLLAASGDITFGPGDIRFTVEPTYFAWQMRGKIVRIILACKLSEPILRYIFINGNELCPEQVCKLCGACELVRVK